VGSQEPFRALLEGAFHAPSPTPLASDATPPYVALGRRLDQLDLAGGATPSRARRLSAGPIGASGRPPMHVAVPPPGLIPLRMEAPSPPPNDDLDPSQLSAFGTVELDASDAVIGDITMPGVPSIRTNSYCSSYCSSTRPEEARPLPSFMDAPTARASKLDVAVAAFSSNDTTPLEEDIMTDEGEFVHDVDLDSLPLVSASDIDPVVPVADPSTLDGFTVRMMGDAADTAQSHARAHMLYLMAVDEMAAGNPARAQEHLELALSYDPGNVLFTDVLAQAKRMQQLLR
jgi:hypothetical protein